MIPTFGGFLAFVRNQVGISTTVLPDDSVYLLWAYTVAVELVNVSIQAVSPTIYMLAVYNLAASNLLNFAQDQTGQTYFRDIRATFDINGLVPGIVSSSSDQSTSTTFLIPDSLKNLSIADLQYLKDPYGRQYYSFAQRYTNVWGLT